MSFLFGKKQQVQALAELLEDGRARFNEEMKKPRYRDYKGAEPTLELAVRVLPENEPPFEARMNVGITHSYLLKPGVRVQVRYDPARRLKVTIDDTNPEILARNPQLSQQQ